MSRILFKLKTFIFKRKRFSMYPPYYEEIIRVLREENRYLQQLLIEKNDD